MTMANQQNQQNQQIDQQLRQNWRNVRHQILDQFAQVSTADLDSAQNVTDLVQRIADKSHHSERFVETRLAELVGVGVQSSQSGQSGSSYGQQSGSGQGNQGSARRYGASEQQ